MKLTKHIIGIVLVAALSIGTFVTATPAIAASVKPGSSCAKAGTTSLLKVKGIQTKFTCVKSGKKLVWSKGTLVVPSKSIAIGEPNPSAPLPAISINNLDTKQIRALAYIEVAREMAENMAFLPTITYIVGPSLTKAKVDAEKAGLNRAASFWSDIYKPDSIYIGYFAEKDVDWVDKAFCDGAGYCPVSGTGAPLVSEQIKNDGKMFCNFAQATRGSKGQFFDQCLGVGSDDFKSAQTGPHEYTHFAQAGASSIDVPNWWVEGSAAYFGGALGAYNGSKLPAIMDKMINIDSRNYVEQDLTIIDPKSEASVFDGFKFTYRRGSPPTPGSRWMLAHVSYYPGALATEAMVALWGMDRLKTFMTSLKTGNFDDRFEEAFGVKTDVFYMAVAKYVVAMYAQGR